MQNLNHINYYQIQQPAEGNQNEENPLIAINRIPLPVPQVAIQRNLQDHGFNYMGHVIFF